MMPTSEHSTTSQTIVYQADNLEMRGELYRPDTENHGESRPGVLVFPELYGLNEHSKERAQRLAAMGYVALACDLHGGGTAYADLPSVMGLVGPLRENPSKIQARAQGALDTLLLQDGVDANRIAAIGFCFGGTMALELARSGAALAAVVSFHGTLRTHHPEDAAQIRARVLVATGADDPMIDLAQRTAFEDEMRNGGVDWQMHVYGGAVHSFTNPAADKAGRPDAVRYSPSADARSWKAMRTLFDEAFA